jgi:hypothetical protein
MSPLKLCHLGSADPAGAEKLAAGGPQALSGRARSSTLPTTHEGMAIGTVIWQIYSDKESNPKLPQQ